MGPPGQSEGWEAEDTGSAFEATGLVPCGTAALDFVGAVLLAEVTHVPLECGILETSFSLVSMPWVYLSMFPGCGRISLPGGLHGVSYVPLPGDAVSPSVLQWAQWLREDRSCQDNRALPEQPGAGAGKRPKTSSEGQLAFSQRSRRDRPSPLGGEGGLQASGPYLGAAPGIAYCGAGWGVGLPLSMDAHKVSSAGVPLSAFRRCPRDT